MNLNCLKLPRLLPVLAALCLVTHEWHLELTQIQQDLAAPCWSLSLYTPKDPPRMDALRIPV